MKTPKITLRPSRPKSDKTVIVTRAYFNNETFTHSTGISINPKHWDPKTMSVHHKARNSSNDNDEIKKYKRKLEDIFDDLISKNRLTVWNVKKALDNKPLIQQLSKKYDHNNYIELFEYEFVPRKKKLDKNTITGYRSTCPLLLEFNRKINPKNYKNVSIHDINTIDFYDDFLQFMKSKGDIAINTQDKHIKNIKIIMNYAAKKGYLNTYEFRDFERFSIHSQPLYLTKKELEQIYNCDMPSEKLDNAKDWLLISCYTALRVSDLLSLDKDAINLNTRIISTDTIKTGTFVEIPIHEIVSIIINKRSGLPRKLSDQKYNEYIKEVCKIAKINSKVFVTKKGVASYRMKHEIVSSHIGRRSFATNNFLDNLIHPEKLKLITGHASVKMLMRYIAIDKTEAAIELGNAWKNSESFF